MSLFDFTYRNIFIFALVFFRVGGFFFTAPILSSQNFPNRVKIGAALVISFLLLPTIPAGEVPFPPPHIGYMLIGTFFEVVVGAVMGFVATIPFAAYQTAGSFVGQEMGLALANVFDPISNQQVAILGQFYLLFSMVIWVSLEGHLALMSALGDSFSTILPMQFVFNPDFFRSIPGELGQYMFELAIKTAAPAMVALFLTTVALGFMAKTVPEMNVFILGFAIRIAVGFVIILASLPAFNYLVEYGHADILHVINSFLEASS